MKLYGKHTRAVADRIVDAFRHPEKLPVALAPIFIHRNDDLPCRQWSWHNQLLVALSGTADARGFRQWKKVGRNVKAGASALWILGPCLKIIEETDTRGQTKQRQILYGFRSIPVFALEDTEGDNLPDADAEAHEWLQALPLIEVAKDWGITVNTYSSREGYPLGYYQHASNGNQAIVLGVENLSTWAHELVHAADHRVTNLKGDKWHKEVVAELGGAVLLECMGMTHDADLGGAFEYIRSYAEAEKLDVVRACIQVLDRVCDCVKLILDTADAVPAPMESALPAVPLSK